MPKFPKVYDYVIPDIRDWPLYQLGQEREQFMEQVVDSTLQGILQSSKYKAGLSEEIAKVIYMERQRLRDTPWAVDPKDEDAFWKGIRKELMRKSLDGVPDEQENDNNRILLGKILRRYVSEITGSFEISTYRLVRRLLTYLFKTMLNAFSIPLFSRFLRANFTVDDKVKMMGQIDHIRELAKKGTVVLVPTHFSNLDSILIGWSLDKIGMPAFSYGAGLNLYNSPFFAYFMRRLGAYTVDRRKKNAFYLETIKNFSRISIARGTHSLFFPGGTRSRSGQLEDKIKLGLLGTAIDAQNDHHLADKDEKVFIVPLVLNYHFVLEAKSLIEQFLSNTGKELYLVEKHPFGGFFGLFKFMIKFFRKSSEIILNFGKPMDVMGNFVDTEGRSVDQFGCEIDIKDYFVSQGATKFDRQRNEQYTQHLADKLVERYHEENVVLTSHLIAFTAFQFFKKKHSSLDLYGVMRLPKDDCRIPLDAFKNAAQSVVDQLMWLAERDKVQLSYQIIHGSMDDIIGHGLENLGAFHNEKALAMDKKANEIYSDDMALLYYYQNRLEGYSLDKEFKVSK